MYIVIPRASTKNKIQRDIMCACVCVHTHTRDQNNSLRHIQKGQKKAEYRKRE